LAGSLVQPAVSINLPLWCALHRRMSVASSARTDIAQSAPEYFSSMTKGEKNTPLIKCTI
jgi:hypothetical protein